MSIEVEAIGYVQAPRPHVEDDFWGGEQARIELVPQFAPDALAGLGEFSHIEVLFYFHQVDPAKIVAGARHPRNNQQWPAVGIFAQRGKNRPNRLGTTICTLVRVEGRALVVQELDAIDGTPILVFWSKAAKALSTTPSKGVTFAGYVSSGFSVGSPFCIAWRYAGRAPIRCR